jgi:hypothetical protein
MVSSPPLVLYGDEDDARGGFVPITDLSAVIRGEKASRPVNTARKLLVARQAPRGCEPRQKLSKSRAFRFKRLLQMRELINRNSTDPLLKYVEYVELEEPIEFFGRSISNADHFIAPHHLYTSPR